MAGITQKSCVALFSLWSLKKFFLEWDNRCESTETYKKFGVLTKSHVSIMTTVTIIVIIVISVITKMKNSISNNGDY